MWDGQCGKIIAGDIGLHCLVYFSSDQAAKIRNSSQRNCRKTFFQKRMCLCLNSLPENRLCLDLNSFTEL